MRGRVGEKGVVNKQTNKQTTQPVKHLSGGRGVSR